MDPFEEIRYLQWDLEGVEDFEHAPSHSTLSERLKKTLYLTEGCSEGMSLPVADDAVELFQAVSGSPLKKISPRHVANLSKRSRVAPCTLLLAMIYARRLKTMNEDYVKNMTAPDLLLVSMMVASKFLYDEGEDEEMFSDEWAAAANVDLNRVYELEREFLSAMDWNLFVHNEEFYEFIRQFETRIALRQGMGRGWFSYSDMEILMAQSGWLVSCKVVMHQAITVVAACITVYTVCATTLIWSSMVLRHTAVNAPCAGLPLDLHVERSTLMHHPPSALPMSSCVGGSAVQELTPQACNGSLATDGCESDDVISEEGGTIWEMTSALNHKYQAARSALVIFYQALITSLQEIGCDDDDDDDEMCDFWGASDWLDGSDAVMMPDPCRCLEGGSGTCSRTTMNLSAVGPCRCGGLENRLNHHVCDPCRLGHCKEGGTRCCLGHNTSNRSNSSFVAPCHCQNRQLVVNPGHPSDMSSNSGLWLVSWLMRGDISSCKTVAPDLSCRFVDLDSRFSTISY